jgi:colanic acid/amylovoran biosynthesis glycosyltransferase
MGKSGEEETRDAAFATIRRFGIEHLVTWSPLLPFHELLRLGLDCHLFVAPSVTASNGDCEGTPFVLQQMMATGMPAIATVHSDIPFIFGDLKHLLVPERDSGAIADRLQQYAEDPDRLISDGVAMRNRIRSAFDVRHCAARLAEIYQSLITS